MKARILSFAIALIALFSFGNAYAQSPHFVGTVCFDAKTSTISGKVSGVGNDISNFSIEIVGQYSCQNKGENDPGPWQNLPVINVDLVPTTKTGTYTFSEKVDLCKRNWKTSIAGYANLYQGTSLEDSESICVK